MHNKTPFHTIFSGRIDINVDTFIKAKSKRKIKVENYSILSNLRIFCIKGEFMNNQGILFALLLSVFANATDTSLNTNTNFLLLLLLALGGNNNCCCGCNQNNSTFTTATFI